MQPVTVPLSHPVEFKGQSLSSLTFRKPKVIDLIVASKEPTPLEQTMVMLSRLCDLDFDTFGEIDATDLQSIVIATSDMLGNVKSAEIGSA